MLKKKHNRPACLSQTSAVVSVWKCRNLNLFPMPPCGKWRPLSGILNVNLEIFFFFVAKVVPAGAGAALRTFKEISNKEDSAERARQPNV